MHERHGQCSTRLYEAWTGIRRRCNNKNIWNYKNYGGRGIAYDSRWNNFENFYEDMHESHDIHLKMHGPRNTSIDRIDNNKDYSKENCRWATRKEQANNCRNNYILEFQGKNLTISQWAEETKLPREMIRGRVRLGWPTEKILTRPARKSRKRRLAGCD